MLSRIGPKSVFTRSPARHSNGNRSLVLGFGAALMKTTTSCCPRYLGRDLVGLSPASVLGLGCWPLGRRYRSTAAVWVVIDGSLECDPIREDTFSE